MIGGWSQFARDVFDNATRGRDLFADSTHGWKGVSGVSVCGAFGGIIGGQFFLGHGFALTESLRLAAALTLLRQLHGMHRLRMWILSCEFSFACDRQFEDLEALHRAAAAHATSDQDNVCEN